jgi:hypothetical protein
MTTEAQLCFIRPGKPRGKRIHREFQRPAARRVLERGVVHVAGRRSAEAGEVPRALQSHSVRTVP